MRKVLHLMGALTDEDVEWLISCGPAHFIPEGTKVIREGHPIDALMIVLEGELLVTVSAANHAVAKLHPGEVLGEISFVDARPPSASVVATSQSHLLVVPKLALSNRLTRDEAFAARFYRALAIFLVDRLRKSTAHLGYGKWVEEAEAEIDEDSLGDISMAVRRFDHMLQQLRVAH